MIIDYRNIIIDINKNSQFKIITPITNRFITHFKKTIFTTFSVYDTKNKKEVPLYVYLNNNKDLSDFEIKYLQQCPNVIDKKW